MTTDNLLSKAIEHFSKHPEFFTGIKPGATMTITIENVGSYTVKVIDENNVEVRKGADESCDIEFIVTPEAEDELIKQNTAEAFGRLLLKYYIKPEDKKKVAINPKKSIIEISKKGYIAWTAKIGFKKLLG